MSSTATASVYSGLPSARTSTKSGTSAWSKVTSPRTRSVNVVDAAPACGTGSPAAAPRPDTPRPGPRSPSGNDRRSRSARPPCAPPPGAQPSSSVRAVAVIGVPAFRVRAAPTPRSFPSARSAGTARTARPPGALVPAQPEPAQRVQRRGDVLRGDPGLVGVLDPQHETRRRCAGRTPSRTARCGCCRRAGCRWATGRTGPGPAEAPQNWPWAQSRSTTRLVSVPMPCDGHRDGVAGHQPADPGRRTGEQHVTGQQRHHRLTKLTRRHMSSSWKVRACCLTSPLTVVVSLQVGRVQAGLDPRAERAEPVEALGPGPLPVLGLQVPRGHVVGAGVAE